MFGSKGHTHTETAERAPMARGGVSFGPVLTGVVVAFGAMFLLSAVVGGVLAGLGVTETIDNGETFEAGIGAGIALVVAQLLAYLWGGYTAGRMSRGAGLANGLLVPLGALVVAVIVGAVAAALGATANLNLPFTTNRLPLENDLLVDWGVTIGIASLLAMFIGGAVGGLTGARWHTKLERRALEERKDEDAAHDHVHTTATPGTETADRSVSDKGTRTHPSGDLKEEDGTYTQRSSAETQTFRS